MKKLSSLEKIAIEVHGYLLDNPRHNHLSDKIWESFSNAVFKALKK